LPEAAAQARASSATPARPPANRADTTLKKDDASPEDLQPFYYKMMGYHEASVLGDRDAGLSAAYVTSETKRAIAGKGGRVKIFPGIDIDVPTAADEKHTKPEDVCAATAAA
jgi:hypothetical protein